MITDLFLKLLDSIITGVLGILPSFGVPSFITSAGGYVSTVTSYAAQLGNWVPWPIAITGVLCVFAAIAVAWGIKVVRMIASFLTLGGGSAA